MTTLRSTGAIASTPIGGQALLYGAAAKAVRAGGAREMQAARLRASLADTSAWAALMEWAVFRYIDFVAADMAGGDGGGQADYDTHRGAAPAEPLSEAPGQVVTDTRENCAGASDAGEEAPPPAREPSLADRVAARKAAERAAVTIMDTIRVRDGRALGDVAFGELRRMASTNRREAALFDLIRAHGTPASEFVRVREIVGIGELQRMMQKAAEVADGHEPAGETENAK